MSIHSTESFKLLGMYIDPKLTWAAHIKFLCKRLSVSCYIIRNIRGTVSVGVLKMLYYGIVYSHLQYGLLLWGSSAHMHKVFICQKKILRCMAKTNRGSSCKPLFHKYGILTLPSMYIMQLIIYIKNNYHNYHKNSDLHNYNTRNCSSLQLPFSRLSVSQNSPIYMGIKCFNKIRTLIDTDNLNQNVFRKKLKSYLTEKIFYSVDEFLNP